MPIPLKVMINMLVAINVPGDCPVCGKGTLKNCGKCVAETFQKHIKNECSASHTHTCIICGEDNFISYINPSFLNRG